MKFLANLFGASAAEAKNLTESRAQLAAAKSAAEQVAALFTAAGLDIDVMLAAGPDSLRVHLASLSAAGGALDAALGQIVNLKASVATAAAASAAEQVKYDAAAGILTTIGVKSDTKPEAYPAVLASYVKKQSALVLAATGHAPVSETGAIDTTKPAAAATDPNLKGLARTTAAFKAKAEAAKLK